jgi:ankyrin repeat protein
MGMTALHYCVSGSKPGVEKLLERGADVHARDSEGNTPLHLLQLTSKTAPILESLVRYGARWDAIRESDGKSPLFTSLECQHPDFGIQYLQLYLNDWYIPDAKGNTPLHSIIKRGNLTAGVLKVLLERLAEIGTNINQKNHKGKVPLHLLNGYHAKHFGSLLLAAGADLEARDHRDRTWFLRVALYETSDPAAITPMDPFSRRESPGSGPRGK